MAAISQEQVKSLDQMRLRLLSLRNALAKMQENIAVSQPLPSPAQLQASSNHIATYLKEIAEQMQYHQKLLSSTIVFPLPQFPGKYQGHILTDTILRTKLEPGVIEWIEQGEKTSENGRGGLSEHDRDRFWEWAPTIVTPEVSSQLFGSDYTRAEVEAGIDQVITGLRRQLVVPQLNGDESGPDDNDDGDDGDEEGEDSGEEDEEIMDEDETGSRRRPRRIVSNIESTPILPQTAAYLESLQEFMTTGRFDQFDRKTVDERKRREGERQGGLAR